MCFRSAAAITFLKTKIASVLGPWIIYLLFITFYHLRHCPGSQLGMFSLLALIYFSSPEILPEHICSLYFNPGCPLDWAGAEATRRLRVRHPAGSLRRWQWRVDASSQRPGGTGGCWPGGDPQSCGARGRAQAKVSWLTTRSSRAGAYPELA